MIETIEKICNEKNDEYLYNHLLTDFGRRRMPWEIHRIMHEEYGLADIEESENNNSKDEDIKKMLEEMDANKDKSSSN